MHGQVSDVVLFSIHPKFIWRQKSVESSRTSDEAGFEPAFAMYSPPAFAKN